MFCKYCGQPVNAQARFCTHCGKQLNNSPQPTAPVQPIAPPQPKPVNGFGIAALVLGIVSLILGLYICPVSIVGIVLGAVGVAFRKKYRLNGMAIAGLVLSCVALLFWGFIWFACFFVSFSWLIFLPFFWI